MKQNTHLDDRFMSNFSQSKNSIRRTTIGALALGIVSLGYVGHLLHSVSKDFDIRQSESRIEMLLEKDSSQIQPDELKFYANRIGIGDEYLLELDNARSQVPVDVFRENEGAFSQATLRLVFEKYKSPYNK